jgi:S1-C subfamily serine protease
MALIPPFFLDCVVSIGAQTDDGPVWFGTGFIVGRPIDINAKDVLFNTFLVTNKHVLKDNKEILIRFNTLQGSQIKDYPVPLEINGQKIWVEHPTADVDIAVFLINPQVLKNDSAVFSFFQLHSHAMYVADMLANGASEGDPVFVLGFPLGIVSAQSKYVIARSGSIARIRDVLANQQSSFLIDANIFPGNSGGPVVTRPEISAIQGTKAINKAALIGIVKSYVPFRDVAVSQQTGNPRVIFEENSGLALVETTDNIKVTVELCFQQKVQQNP